MVDLDDKKNVRELFAVAFAELWGEDLATWDWEQVFDSGGLENLDFEELRGVVGQGLVLLFHSDFEVYYIALHRKRDYVLANMLLFMPVKFKITS